MFARHYAEAFDLSIPECRVIALIGRAGTLSPSAVGAGTAMDKVKVSRAAANLVARGMLKQAADPSDGRGRRLSLMRKGATVHEQLIPLARELEARLSQGLGRAERAALGKALSRLIAHVQTIDGSDGDGDPD